MRLTNCFKASVFAALNLQERRLYSILSYPLRMIHHVGKPRHVVHQVDQPNLGTRPDKPNTPDPATYQKADPTKDVLNPRPDRRLLFVHRLLKGTQGMVTIPLLRWIQSLIRRFFKRSRISSEQYALSPHMA